MRGPGIAPAVAGLVVVALLACADAPPRNVLLVSIDTLRADHLGAYGYPRDTSATFDRLATEGVLYERAIATSSWTVPSHLSMLTGRYVRTHGVRRTVDRPAPELRRHSPACCGRRAGPRPRW